MKTLDFRAARPKLRLSIASFVPPCSHTNPTEVYWPFLPGCFAIGAETGVEICQGTDHTFPYPLADKGQTSSNELLPAPSPIGADHLAHTRSHSHSFSLSILPSVVAGTYHSQTLAHYHTPTKPHCTTQHFLRSHTSQKRDGPGQHLHLCPSPATYHHTSMLTA